MDKGRRTLTEKKDSVVFNLYISKKKLEELRKKADAQDLPLSSYIKTKLFPE